VPEASGKPGPDRREGYRRIADRLREVATEVRNAATRGSEAERDLLSVRQKLQVVDQELGRSLDQVRVKLSEERRVAAVADRDSSRFSWATPAVMESDEVLAWLGEYQHRDTRPQFVIVERGGPDDRYGRESGAVAEISGSDATDYIFLGGELGIRLLRAWPKAKSGALSRLGPTGVARLVAGRMGEERVKAIAEARERQRLESREREAILEKRAEGVMGEAGANIWLSWKRRQKACDSAEGLGEAVAELEPGEYPDGGAGLIARMRILDELFASASLLPYHHRAVYQRACEAALESGEALAELLSVWHAEPSRIEFGKSALNRARRSLAATTSTAPEGSHPPAAPVEKG
jgi:hypothetical protein